MLLFCLVGFASAHLPHPAVIGVAAPQDLETSQRAWATLVVDGSVMGLGWTVVETQDAGRHWDPIVRPAFGGDAPVIAADATGPWLLGGGHLYHLQAGVWEDITLPSVNVAVLAASNSGVVVGGPSGAWWLPTAASSWQALTNQGVLNVAMGDRVSLLLASGSLLRGAPDALATVSLPGDANLMAEDGAGRLYMAGRGGFWTLEADDTWTPCGVITPADPRATYATAVVRLAASPTTLLVGTGQSLYRSIDRCATFEETVPFVDPMDYSGGAGSASGPDAAYTGLAVVGSTEMVVGYRGAAVETGRGAWWEPRLLDGTFSRGLAVTDGGANVWTTSYGGGFLASADRGDSWTVSARFETMEGSYGRDVSPLPDGDAAYLGDLWSYRIGAAGASTLDVGLASPRALWDVGEEAWCLGIASDTADLTHTADGVTWTPGELGEGDVSEVRRETWGGAPVVVAVLQRPGRVVVSTDNGANWSTWMDDGRDTSGIAVWSAADRLVRALTDGGVELTEGSETRAAVAPPPAPLTRIVADDGGGLNAFDVTGTLWRSADGGDTWVGSAGRVDTPQDLVGVPGLLFASGLRGTFWSEDGGDTWVALSRVEKLDIRNTGIGCLGPDARPCARDVPLAEFSTLTISTRANAMTVEATGASALDVSLDGGPSAPLDLGTELPLGGGEWHDVTLLVMGEALTVDALSFRYDGTAAPVTDTGDSGDSGDTGPGETGLYDTGLYDTGLYDSGEKTSGDPGCGCGGSTPTSLAPLLGAVALLRRRRRPV